MYIHILQRPRRAVEEEVVPCSVAGPTDASRTADLCGGRPEDTKRGVRREVALAYETDFVQRTELYNLAENQSHSLTLMLIP